MKEKSTRKDKTKLFLANRKNANLLPEILSSLYDEDEDNRSELLSTVRCFKTIFTELVLRGDFNHEIYTEISMHRYSLENFSHFWLMESVDSADYKYSIWLRDLYIEAVEKLTKIMRSDGASVKLRDLGIETLITLDSLEQENRGKFPKIDHNLIVLLIEAFLEPESNLTENSAQLLEFLKSFKFRIEFTQKVKKIVEVRSSSKVKLDEDWMKNVLKVIRTILKAETSSMSTTTPVSTETSTSGLGEERKQFKKEFSKLWMEVMKWENTTPAIVRLIVAMLPDHVMEHLEKPILMSDFLLESFKIPGPIGILSLRGIFILMIKYNFDVPDFYTKLYSLFQLPVLQSNYRARFFRYADSFLASSHLPEYLVAAFVKKLSRMSLHAPTPTIPLICNFIVNLMIKHPGLQVLIHNTKAKKIDSSDASGGASVSSDLFDSNESNPSKTKAMESSLWEMKTLQNHILPNVAQAASFIEKPLPKVEYDLEETLSMDYDDMFEQEINKKKNIDPVQPKVWEDCNFEFSDELCNLSNEIHVHCSKRQKVS